ncbi:MAG: hypothetical protein OEL89_00735, partial [Candidatus Peregrinibacteria bacterium]|nr:hypothetical protein [Candidatus Peregrinibacteria bacterium]
QVREQVGEQVWKQVGEQVREQVWNQVGKQVREQVLDQVWKQVGEQVWDQVRDQVGEQVGEQVWDQVWEQVRDQVGNQVWDQVWDQVGNQVREQVWDQVRDQVGEQVGNQVGDQAWEQVGDQVREQVGDQVGEQKKLRYHYESYYLSIRDLYWISFYDFFARLNLIDSIKFTKYKELIKSNIFSCILLHGFAFLSRPPLYIHRNEKFRLHSRNSPAIEFKDGFKLYYVDGIHFSESDFNKYFIETPTANEVLEMKNQEQRAVMIKHVGYKNMKQELKLREISNHIDAHGNKNSLYESRVLLIKLVKAIDSSTGKPYYLGVPRSQTDCLEAIAWTFGLTKDEYKKRIES